VHFIPLHHQPYFKRLLASQRPQTFPGADAAFARIVSLPFYPGLSDDLVDRICEEIDGIRMSAKESPVTRRVVA
jgi:dTDP-4-amino-4,6-dideoxygalactose transaminase